MSAQTREELLRQLAFIEDPVKRLKEMFKHGLLAEAEAELLAMVRDLSPIYFQDSSRVRNEALIGTLTKGNKFVICLGHYLGTDNTMCIFDHEWLKQLMGWSDEKLNAFMVEVMRRAITTVDSANLNRDIASWGGSWEINATLNAMNKFIPSGHELRQNVELWILRAWFFEGAYISGFNEKMLKKRLGRKICKNRFQQYDHRYLEDDLRHEQEVNEAIIARMRELGRTDDEIREDCYVWLERFVDHLNPSLLVGVANASIFQWKDARRAEIMSRQAKTAMEYLFEGRVLFHPLIVAKLIDAHMLDGSAKDLYRQHTSQCLAKGRIGLATEITAMLGHRFFGYSKGWDSNSPIAFDLNECAALAFDIAWQKSEFGIAAALVLQFGAEWCLSEVLLQARAEALVAEEGDGESVEAKLESLVAERRTQIETAYDLARTTGKPIKLDYSTVFTPKL